MSHYTIMSRQFKSHYLRDWLLEGSVSGADWQSLCTHSDDDSLAGGLGKTHTWEIGDMNDAADMNSAADAETVRRDRG